MNFKIPLQGANLARWPRGNLTQGYSENAQLYQSLVGIKFHNGIDIAMPFRTPVLAAYDGTVYEAFHALKGYGKQVRIISGKVDGVYYDSVYGHLDEIIVKVGQRVKVGEQLGFEGNTGFVVSEGTIVFWGNAPAQKGVHLHFGIRILTDATEKSNIAIFGKNYIIKDYNNGVHGYIDPLPYFNQPISYQPNQNTMLKLIGENSTQKQYVLMPNGKDLRHIAGVGTLEAGHNDKLWDMRAVSWIDDFSMYNILPEDFIIAKV